MSHSSLSACASPRSACAASTSSFIAAFFGSTTSTFSLVTLAIIASVSPTVFIRSGFNAVS